MESFHSLSPYNHLCILIIGTTMEHLLGSCSAECFTYLNACSPRINLWAGTLVTPDLWVWEQSVEKLSNLLAFTKLVSGRAKASIQII